jgi:hypothetical protein
MTKTLYDRLETELPSDLYLCHDFNKIEAEFLKLTKLWLDEMREKLRINTVTTMDSEMSGVREDTFDALEETLNRQPIKENRQ